MARRVVRTETEEVPVVERERVVDREVVGERNRLEDVIWFITAIIATLLLVRFVLLLFGAREGTPFVDFWYGISSPLVAPFAGMFGNSDTFTEYAGSRLEVESLVALLIYSLLAYLIILGIRLLTRKA